MPGDRLQSENGFNRTAFGSPRLLGTIVATTTKNNVDTASAFNATGDGLAGMWLLVQPDAACYVRAVTTTTGTVSSSNGVKLEADEKYEILMRSDDIALAVVSVSGTTNAKVFRRQ